MAIIRVRPNILGLARWYPPDYARDGVGVPALISDASQYTNAVAGTRFKLIFSKSVTQATAATTAAAASTTLATWRFFRHTSPLAKAVRFMFTVSSTSIGPQGGNFPGIQISASPALSPTPSLFATPNDNAGGGNTPNAFRQIYQDVTVSGDTDYTFLVTLVDQPNVSGLAVYELQRTTLDTSVDTYCVDESQFGAPRPIYTTATNQLQTTLQRLWKRQGALGFAWCIDNGTALTRSSATSANVLDATTAYTSGTAGFPVRPQYRNALNDTTLPVRLWAVATQTTGTGTVTFVGSGGTIGSVSITGGSATAATTNSVSLPLTDPNKIDIWFAGDGTHTLSLYAAGLEQYET